MKLIKENIFLKTTSLPQTSSMANYLIVFCHGYGADGKDLINIGSEDNKGSDLLKKSLQELRQINSDSFSFTGFIEGNHIKDGKKKEN